jgi:hypothetical protein
MLGLVNEDITQMVITYFQLFFDLILCHTAPNKENQDAYAILPKLENVKDGAFFGVFDGHGKEGHLCARYAKSKVRSLFYLIFGFLFHLSQLPAGINYFISNMSEETPPDDVKVELLAAHVGINQLVIVLHYYR